MPVREDFYEHLRKLAIEDPREARRTFVSVFEANSRELLELFARLRKPNEGRLRQVIANAMRAHPEKSRVVPELVRWRETETDEFTRRAIEGALADVNISAIQAGNPKVQTATRSDLADTYRYVASRLRHRLRNTMLSAQSYASRLKTLAGTDPEAQTTIAKLNDAMVSMGRELEATDVDPEFFRQRSIGLGDWLRQLNRRYSMRYSPIDLRLINAESPDIRVFASDYLLETIFWNVWINAHQATESECQITISFQVVGPDLVLLVLDNGDGFAEDLKDVVFQQVFSTKDHGKGGRGRGLLEIQDAVERLGGHVELHKTEASGNRIRVRLPVDV
jgi:signal transduction histidine kinase